MIHLPCNVPLLSQIMPGQNVPVQTSCNNFAAFQQPQMAGQQMQTNPCPANPQDPFKPFYQLHQADVYAANHHGQLPLRNPWSQPYQLPPNYPSNTQTQSNCGSLPQNVLDQIRNCVSTAAPIFILPGGCHQSTGHQQTFPSNPPNTSLQTGQSTGVNNPTSIYCPPSFYPYPIPMPVFDPFAVQTRGKGGSRGCSCCRNQQDVSGCNSRPFGCCCNVYEQEEHRCTATTDDTICSKRNCPASISLQALASQLLSLPGIISCATTRLILRKIPGSNITSTMEDTMDKALKAIGTLTKDQLLAESRNAQQVNALINLHMTTNLPANIIPLLTLLQLKVNVLKAQVEASINKKVMECQGYGFEVETSGPIDPTVLTMKTNAELRQLLSALRQKECDERVNANFSPYHSQKVIAEARLTNVQAKIRQVEAEFERRRCVSVPTPPQTLASRVIQQFSESRCTFGFAQANLFEPYVQSALTSPDPFAQAIRCPKRLCLKPYEPIPEASRQREESTAVTTAENGTSMSKDTGTGECAANCSEDKGVQRKSSADTCSCEGSSSSEDSLSGGKKKLRLRIDETGNVTITSRGCMRAVSLLKLAPNVVTEIEKVSEEDRAERLIRKTDGEDFVIITGESVVDDSEIQILDSNRLDSDSGKFEIITISDDDDDNARGKAFDTGTTSVKVEPESDTDTEKKVEIRIDPVKVKTMKSTCYVDVVSIKKEPEAAEDCSSETTTRSIKVEPELKKAEESDETTAIIQPAMKPKVRIKPILRKKENSIKKSVDEKVDEDPSRYVATTSILVGSETEKPEVSAKPILKMKEDHPSTSIERKSKEERKDGKQPFNSKTKVPRLKRKTEDGKGNAAKQSEATLKVEEIKPSRDKDPRAQNTDESSSGKTLFANIKAMFEGKVSTEKPIVEDVSKDQGTGSDAAATGRTPEKRPSDLYKSTLAVTLKPTTRKVAEERRRIKHEWVSSKSEANTEGGGSWEKGKEGGNAEIVSMMARVKYDGQFGDFWGWSIDECINKDRKDQYIKHYGDGFSRNISETGMYLLSEKVNSSFTFNNQRHEPMASLIIETKDKIQGDGLLEKMFPKDRRTIDERTANGLKHFPPLKHSNRDATGTTTGIAVNTSNEEEIESVYWKSFRDRTISYRRDSKMENSIVSAICSMFENQLISFGSFLNNIPNFQDLLSCLHLDKLSRNSYNGNRSRSNEQTFNEPGSKKVRTGWDDWVLPGSSANVRQGDERRASGGNRVSVAEGCSNAREMRHSIIVDREKQNYVLMWGSISGQLRELSRNGFERPYRTRRSLVIRSRPKNPGNSRHGRSRPFTILKRFKKSKLSVPRATKREGQQSKTCEKFSLLPEIPEESWGASDRSSGEFVKVPENEMVEQNIRRDSDTISDSFCLYRFVN
ncbi:uncharacterized protein LOC143433486 [Xylocopa sonorina]|uniref:uncharacterized protein LOC143433486 n=1 Tax=Xylocopa sonorina TaxID=1818115 RepID=UPI00403AF182